MAPRPVWIVLLALLAWTPSVWRCGFLMDDRELLLENPVVAGSLPWSAAFGRDYFGHVQDAGKWRPLATLSLRLGRELGGEAASGQHLANVLLHALVVALAAFVLRRVAAREARWPWFGLALFAVHPALADAVAWISGRTVMVAAAAGLAGAAVLVRALERGWRAPALATVSLAGVLLAAMGREDGALFALVYPALALASSRRAARACALGAALGLGAWLVARGHVLDGAFPAATHDALARASPLRRAGVGGLALLEALRVAVLPFDHSPLVRAEALLARAPRPWPLAAALGWLAWASLAAGGPLAAPRRPAGWSALLAAVALAPALQLVPNSTVFAPRYIYLPLLFGAPLLDALGQRLPARRPLALATLCALVALAWARTGVYAERGAYRGEILRHDPAHAPSWNELGLWREDAGDEAGALAAWRHALALDPGYSRPWSNLGRVQLARGELEEAERSLRNALCNGPRNALAHSNLAGLCLRLGADEEAARLYARAAELAPGFAAAWRGLGNARLRLGDSRGAATALRRALELDPDIPHARELLERAE